MRPFHLNTSNVLILPIARVINNVYLIFNNNFRPIQIKTLILLIIVASETFIALIS